jgi:hypothetical protein
MYLSDLTLRLWAGVALGAFALAALVCCVDYLRAQADQRPRKRREIFKALPVMLSFALKLTTLVVPTMHRHVPWLWTAPLGFALLRWLVKRRRQKRAQETAYSRSLKRTSRKQRISG